MKLSRSAASGSRTVNLLLPILLFCVFVLSAAAVVLFSARIYQRTVTSGSENFDDRVSLAYVTEKVHRSDVGGGVSIGNFDGCEALVLTQEINGTEYITYLYQYGGSLRELYVKSGTSASAESGTAILPLEGFHVEMLSDKLLYAQCVTGTGETVSGCICLRGEKGADLHETAR